MVPLAPKSAGQAGNHDMWTQGRLSRRGRQLLPALPRGQVRVSPLLRVPGFAGRAGHSGFAGVAARRWFSRATIQGTVCTWLFPLSLTKSANGGAPASMPRFVAHSAPRRATRWLGNLKSAAYGAVPIDGRRGTGWSDRDGPAHAAHRLRGPPSRPSTGRRARPWEPEGKGPTSGAGSAAPTTRSQRSRSRTTRRRRMCRRVAPLTCSRKRTISPTSSPRKGQTLTSNHFALHVPLLLSPPWPRKLRVGRPRRMWCCVLAVGATLWLLRGKKRGCAEQGQGQSASEEALAVPATGQASDWLAVFTPSSLAQDIQLDPRSFRGHSLQVARVLQPGWQGIGRGHRFLRQVRGSVLGEGRRAVPELPTTSWRVRFSASQTEVQAFPIQTLPRLDYRGRSTTYPGRVNDFGGAAGVMRSGSGSNGAWANYPEEAAHKPKSCDVARLGHRRHVVRSHRQSGRAARARAAAMGQGAAGFACCIWAQRLVGGGARAQCRGQGACRWVVNLDHSVQGLG